MQLGGGIHFGAYAANEKFPLFSSCRVLLTDSSRPYIFDVFCCLFVDNRADSLNENVSVVVRSFQNEGSLAYFEPRKYLYLLSGNLKIHSEI